MAKEPSPYLQQHAHNPVDWWPWGPQAFAEARRRDVPVFLSIGYATCHWCHVMAHESFEDADVARLMNDAFVNVKVDREERPDIDEAYMAVCQAMTGSGGWPLTVLLTPDRKPFLAGTYFPKTSRHGRIGMLEFVPKLKEAWQSQRKELLQQAEHVVAHTQTAARDEGPSSDLDVTTLQAGTASLAKRFDPVHAGFGGAPKFPSPHQLLFLLRTHSHTRNAATLNMVTRTLQAMADGGIHDHLGGGFHRYSTDPGWLLPHFEKMLYDQAMLAMAYTEAYQATGDPRWQAVARSTLDYVLRDLRDPTGGFHCAEDADSEGEEGRFYVWTRDDIMAALGDADGRLFCDAYGVAREGNFHDEATRRLTGANILHRARPLADVAAAHATTVPAAEARLATCRAKLLTLRARRVRPQLDDKVITDWNGLAIAAFAKAGVTFAEPRYLDAALTAARFLGAHMRRKDGRLRHRFRAGATDEAAFLDDHAYLLWGLLELFDATQDAAWLARACDVAGQLRDRFQAPGGGFWTAPSDGEDLGIRRLEAYDGALPSGNSVAAWQLARLGLLTGDPAWTELAETTVAAFAAQAQEHPQAFTALLCGVDLLVGPTQEIVLAGAANDVAAMRSEVRAAFRPRSVLLAASPALAKAAPWTKEHVAIQGKATAYVCTGNSCKKPATDVATLRAQLA